MYKDFWKWIVKIAQLNIITLNVNICNIRTVLMNIVFYGDIPTQQNYIHEY